MEDIKIMPMALEHIDDVLEIEKLSFSTPWSKEAFIQEVLHNQLSKYLVLMEDQKVIAYGGMWLIIDEAHITNIAVHPLYRGKGRGDQLLNAMIKEAKKEGVYQLTLEVRPSNREALRLYVKYGFEIIGTRKGYYQDTGEDALVMWRR